MAAENAILRYESGQTPYPWEQLTDSGDRQTFEAANAPWSGRSGFEPNIRPYGLATGGAITPGSANDTVDVAALTAYMAGSSAAAGSGLVTVAAASGETVSRGATTDTHRITSVTVNASGAIAMVAGTAAAGFSETRGAAGGPPYIPVGSIEIGQIRLSSTTAAAVKTTEIYQVVGLHQERYDFPVWEEDAAQGTVTFAEPLAAIHTGDVPKWIYATYATPVFATIPRATDWTPAETTHNLTSTPIYGGAVGSSSAAIQQASFTAHLTDGISDGFLALKNQKLWIEFRPDRLKLLPKQLTQGILGISRTFPAAGGITAACTITPESGTLDITS